MIHMILEVLGKKSPNRIMRLFLEHPAEEMRVKDIIRATKLAKLSVITWVKKLVEYDVLLSCRERPHLYRLNSENPSVKQLRIVYNIDYISKKIGKIVGTQIFVYGSFARGDNSEKSDIDLLVIGKERDIIRRLKAADSRIKVSFYTPIEWSMAARKDSVFFESVEKDKIRLR